MNIFAVSEVESWLVLTSQVQCSMILVPGFSHAFCPDFSPQCFSFQDLVMHCPDFSTPCFSFQGSCLLLKTPMMAEVTPSLVDHPDWPLWRTPTQMSWHRGRAERGLARSFSGGRQLKLLFGITGELRFRTQLSWLILDYFAGLMQERHNSSASALDLRLSCINPSICLYGEERYNTLSISHSHFSQKNSRKMFNSSPTTFKDNIWVSFVSFKSEQSSSFHTIFNIMLIWLWSRVCNTWL